MQMHLFTCHHYIISLLVACKQWRRLQPRHRPSPRRPATLAGVAVLLAPGNHGLAAESFLRPRPAQHAVHVLDPHRPGISRQLVEYIHFFLGYFWLFLLRSAFRSCTNACMHMLVHL
jgi:hypothetical protein